MLTLVALRIKSIKNISLRYLHLHLPRTLVIVAFSILSIIGIYLVIWAGFNFLVNLGGAGSLIIKHLFYVLFFIIFFMVALSFAIIYYTVLRGTETYFLIRLPIEERRISFFKFIESAVLAAWIPFGGLIIFIAGYAHINSLPFFVPLLSPLYIIPFMLLSCSFGYAAGIFVLRFFNLKKTFIFTLAAGIIIFYFYTHYQQNNKDVISFFSQNIAFLRLSRLWFMPFSWGAWGIIHLENSSYLRSLVFLLNLWSLSVLSLSLIFANGGKIFLHLFLKYSVPRHKRRYRRGILDNILLSKPFPLNIGNLLLKDIKQFTREPIIWLQFLIFFGLLFFYFINLQRFSYQLLSAMWKNLIIFLNVFSVLCIVAALTIRFVFPQWSLEGKSYWVLKLSPLSIKNIYLEKFIFSLLIMMPVSIILIFISDKMLIAAAQTIYLTTFIVIISSLTLVGCALGCGAYFADFKTNYYLKAVESMGGFIALMLNLGYVVITIFAFTFLGHIFIIKHISGTTRYLLYTAVGWAALSLLLTLTITRLGIKKIKEKEC